MKIELEEPYRSLYKYGYLSIDPRTQRKQIKLTRFDGSNTTTAYARYLLSVEQGKLIPDGFEVDHIDENPSNDSRSNLQILSTEEHKEKSLKYLRENVYKFKSLVCSGCKKTFTITEELLIVEIVADLNLQIIIFVLQSARLKIFTRWVIVLEQSYRN